jgi:hypothetical protein
MFKYLDRALAVVLGLGAAVGHTLGSLTAYAHQPITLLWALNASVLGAMLGGLHLVRSFRPTDRVLAWLLVLPTLFWLGSAIQFGMLIGRPLDPRVVVIVVASVGLIAFSLKTALTARAKSYPRGAVA